MNKPEWWDRFREKIDILDRCWNWTSALNEHGYGVFWLNGGNKFAHRLVYELKHGPIPEGLNVCHHCDNPKCVNPEHLFLGTDKDNQQDSVKKGRNCVGKRHGRTRLTEEDVTAIRNSNELYSVLAERYGIKKGTVSGIRTGIAWKHFPGAVKPLSKVEVGKIGRSRGGRRKHINPTQEVI